MLTFCSICCALQRKCRGVPQRGITAKTDAVIPLWLSSRLLRTTQSFVCLLGLSDGALLSLILMAAYDPADLQMMEELQMELRSEVGHSAAQVESLRACCEPLAPSAGLAGALRQRGRASRQPVFNESPIIWQLPKQSRLEESSAERRFVAPNDIFVSEFLSRRVQPVTYTWMASSFCRNSSNPSNFWYFQMHVLCK